MTDSKRAHAAQTVADLVRAGKLTAPEIAAAARCSRQYVHQVAAALGLKLPARERYDWSQADWSWCNPCVAAAVGGDCTASTASDARHNGGHPASPRRTPCRPGCVSRQAHAAWRQTADWHSCNQCVARVAGVNDRTAAQLRSDLRRKVRTRPEIAEVPPKAPTVCPTCGRRQGGRRGQPTDR